jgi:hypothetical protein
LGIGTRNSRFRGARVLISTLVALLIGVVGCDVADAPAKPGVGDPSAVAANPQGAANSESPPDSTTPFQYGSETAVLPEAPWYEPPEDWNEQHPFLSPNAKPEAHFISLAEGLIEPNPADGGGRAWLESVTPIDPGPESGDSVWRRGESKRDRPLVPAATYQRIEFIYEAGPFGIDEGGVLFVEAEPFWSWTEAQSVDARRPGYTTAAALAEGVDVVPVGPGGAFEIRGRSLAPGEQIRVVYGAGHGGARVDEYAETGSEVLVGVDANGDGTRRWLEPSVLLDIAAREGVGLVAFGPGEAAPGETIEISVAIVDANGNRALWPTESIDATGVSRETFRIESTGDATPPLVIEDGTVESRSERGDPHRIRLTAPEDERTLRLVIRGSGDLEGFETEVNPIVVRDSPRRLVWGDLHGHTRYSDGTGTPRDYFRYARDVARLDVIALTDHDHWGPRPLDERKDHSDEITQLVLEFHEPGRFVTIPGYEWTNWLHGHRHVLYFEEPTPILSAIDPATDRPDELWAALRGKPVLTLAHHSAGEPVATNWLYPPDPELEPLTEVVSVHGMSEAADAPSPITGGIPGNFVRDELLRGARLGFIGSGDSHDGHPGMTHLAAGQSGLAGIYSASLERGALLEAMRARRTFATNGIRPFLEVTIDDTFMGDVRAKPSKNAEQILRIRYEATAPIERIDLIRSGRVAPLSDFDERSLDFERRIPRLEPGEFHYVRIIQTDGGVAWSSPIFVDVEG